MSSNAARSWPSTSSCACASRACCTARSVVAFELGFELRARPTPAHRPCATFRVRAAHRGCPPSRARAARSLRCEAVAFLGQTRVFLTKRIERGLRVFREVGGALRGIGHCRMSAAQPRLLPRAGEIVSGLFGCLQLRRQTCPLVAGASTVPGAGPPDRSSRAAAHSSSSREFREARLEFGALVGELGLRLAECIELVVRDAQGGLHACRSRRPSNGWTPRVPRVLFRRAVRS